MPKLDLDCQNTNSLGLLGFWEVLQHKHDFTGTSKLCKTKHRILEPVSDTVTSTAGRWRVIAGFDKQWKLNHKPVIVSHIKGLQTLSSVSVWVQGNHFLSWKMLYWVCVHVHFQIITGRTCFIKQKREDLFLPFYISKFLISWLCTFRW